MISHSYNVNWKTIASMVFPIVGLIAGFAIATRIVLVAHPHLKASPEPLPASVIPAHQWTASGKATGVDTLLIGDSSCLMGVDAPQLSNLLSASENRRDEVLNCGAISYYALDEFATFVDRLTLDHRNSIKRIVVLVHPEMLRQQNPGRKLNEEALFVNVGPEDDSILERMLAGLGLKLVEQKLIWSKVPIPLANQFGSYYGYQTGLEEYMTKHRGSAVELRTFQPTSEKNLHFVIQDVAVAATLRLRSRLPREVELCAAIMPVPFSSRRPEFSKEIGDLRARWPALLQPCVSLTNLPAALPDNFFSTHTHLSPTGQRVFTRMLASAILQAEARKNVETVH